MNYLGIVSYGIVVAKDINSKRETMQTIYPSSPLPFPAKQLLGAITPSP